MQLGTPKRLTRPLLHARAPSCSTHAYSPRHHRTGRLRVPTRVASAGGRVASASPLEASSSPRPATFQHMPAPARSALDRERSVPPLCLNRHQAAWCLASCIRASPLHHRLAAAATAAPPPAARRLRLCYARLLRQTPSSTWSGCCTVPPLAVSRLHAPLTTALPPARCSMRIIVNYCLQESEAGPCPWAHGSLGYTVP